MAEPAVTMRWSRAWLAWLLIIIGETAHGVLRQVLVVPAIGDLAARQWGVLSGSLIILALACLTIRRIGAVTARAQFGVGLLWVLLTLLFEFTLGLALGYPLERLLADYRLDQGGFMGLGLLFMLATPWLAARLRGRASMPTSRASSGGDRHEH
jgi:hypothetical protein